tara:strand:+ start:150 stop:776 length:627 start_codon:yes stop_codon:yes gene_type:complete
MVPIGKIMAMNLRIVVPPHPLIAHWLTMLRNNLTPEPLYATGFEELGKWLTYEALRDWLPYKKETVNTGTIETTGQVIESEVPLLSIPFSAGGFHLWQGGRKVLPNSALCLKGVPKLIEKKAGLIIFIDQISNGETLINILEELKSHKVETQRIRVITALSCSEGLSIIGKSVENLNIYCACIDSELKDKNNLIPGIGNPSLRLNTRT